MRRAPVVTVLGLSAAILVAAVPAGVGQVLERNNFDVTKRTSYINAAACADSASAPRLALEWNTQLTGTFDTAGSYDIYASNVAPEGNVCPTVDDPNKSPQVFADRVTSFDADTVVQQESVSGADVVAAASDPASAVTSCTSSDENKVVYVCAHLMSGTERRGQASGTFTVQVKAPDRPVIRDVLSGNGRLEVTWDPGPGGDVEADSYVAFASTVAGGQAVASATTDAESVTIGALANFTTYSVTVRAASVGGNLSDPSFAVSGTPAPSAGFLDVYGGVEKGGCSTGTAGALALLGTALVLAVRRRVR